jgi:hypothetical protein
MRKITKDKYNTAFFHSDKGSIYGFMKIAFISDVVIGVVWVCFLENFPKQAVG